MSCFEDLDLSPLFKMFLSLFVFHFYVHVAHVHAIGSWSLETGARLETPAFFLFFFISYFPFSEL